MPTSTPSSTDLLVLKVWRPDDDLLTAIRKMFAYGPGDDRATGYLFGDGQSWPEPLECSGRLLLDALDRDLGIRFEVVAFQAYRNGSGCDWHADTPFDAQAVLSLGATRTFGTRPVGGAPTWIVVSHGDLMVMPSGFQQSHQHCVPVEAETGERVSIVFRTVARS